MAHATCESLPTCSFVRRPCRPRVDVARAYLRWSARRRSARHGARHCMRAWSSRASSGRRVPPARRRCAAWATGRRSCRAACVCCSRVVSCWVGRSVSRRWAARRQRRARLSRDEANGNRIEPPQSHSHTHVSRRMDAHDDRHTRTAPLSDTHTDARTREVSEGRGWSLVHCMRVLSSLLSVNSRADPPSTRHFSSQPIHCCSRQAARCTTSTATLFTSPPPRSLPCLRVLCSMATSVVRPSTPPAVSSPSRRLPYFSNSEVALHNVSNDCWVSYFGNVYDLTKLVQENKGQKTAAAYGSFFVRDEQSHRAEAHHKLAVANVTPMPSLYCLQACSFSPSSSSPARISHTGSIRRRRR